MNMAVTATIYVCSGLWSYLGTPVINLRVRTYSLSWDFLWRIDSRKFILCLDIVLCSSNDFTAFGWCSWQHIMSLAMLLLPSTPKVQIPSIKPPSHHGGCRWVWWPNCQIRTKLLSVKIRCWQGWMFVWVAVLQRRWYLDLIKSPVGHAVIYSRQLHLPGTW